MKKSCCVNLDKLLEDYCQIEKKVSEMNGKNKLLEIQLEKSNKMWKLSHTKEADTKDDCAALKNVIKGLQETVEKQCDIRDENLSLKRRINILEGKLQAAMEEYKNNVDLIMSEMKTKEEEYKVQIQKIQREMDAKLFGFDSRCSDFLVKLKEEETNSLLSKKDEEIAALTKQLRNKETEKQSELIKQQIEFNAKLARIQNKAAKSHPERSTLSQNIYRMKLQHIQEEKYKEIESLRNKIKDLEQQLSSGQDSRLKRRRL
ncbi:coiled-coil domain-containing protein 152 [Rhinophrynus dorsalis]